MLAITADSRNLNKSSTAFIELRRFFKRYVADYLCNEAEKLV